MFSKVIFSICLLLLAYYWQTRLKQGPLYYSEKTLEGKTVLITGGNAGIGKYTAIEVAKKKGRLIIASRNLKKSQITKDEIIKLTGTTTEIKIMKLDLEDFQSVRTFANDLLANEEQIDYLVNNAGVFFVPGLTSHGYGKVFTINHLGHFLLTNLLLPKMKQQSVKAPVRIINVASVMYKFGSLDWNSLHYDPKGILQNFKVYCDSKLANIYFTKELSRRVSSYNITTYSVHPGTIYSELGNNIFHLHDTLWWLLGYIFLRETKYGAQTIMYTILDDDVIKYSGDYFSDCVREELWDHARNETLGEELWEKSLEMIQIP